MNGLTVFKNAEFGEIRTVEIKGEPWFVGKDVAGVLGYADQNKAIADHVDEDDKLNDKTALSLGQRGGWLVNESGLYALLFSMQPQKANSAGATDAYPIEVQKRIQQTFKGEIK